MTTRKPRSPEPDGFANFWKIWQPVARKNDGRALARDAFRKHCDAGADPADIVDGARWYVRNLTDKEKPYVPLSQTWLNRGTYEDLCERERAFQAAQAARATEAAARRADNVTPITRGQQPGQTAFLREYNRQHRSD